MIEYHPRENTALILNAAMAAINSVPYRVSNRWAFYQVHQKGLLSKNDSNKFDEWTATARKCFWNGWRPGTFSDSVRFSYVRGIPEEAIPAVPDSIRDQDYYLEIWFEAKAMFEQFAHFTEDIPITLVPFSGDLSISMKWDIAQRLKERWNTYGKHIFILYFGDLDEKGLSIPESALRDIRPWSGLDFSFVRCGLNADQVKRYNVIDNPEKPGCYQWEALSDSVACEIVLSSLNKYWKYKEDF